MIRFVFHLFTVTSWVYITVMFILEYIQTGLPPTLGWAMLYGVLTLASIYIVLIWIDKTKRK